jgi:galactosylceramidase
MALLFLLLAFLTAARAANVSATLSSTGIAHVFDGIGALSAGASSRLLWDYPEPQLSQILDYLFKPQFGASLSILKVEVGGDIQSTDGTEFTHMHDRGQLDCSGLQYEGFLIQEAKKRNPNILTYGLSWGVPGWVGNNTYYSAENIDYQTAWVTCVRQRTGFDIDYLGLWNEKPQPPNEIYVLSLKAALANAGFGKTKIIVMDGGWDVAEFQLAQTNVTFAAAVYGAGLHYPCNKPHPETAEVGWALWASEDYSRDPSWSSGATYWGKALSQNYVLMNATATISWSLIWSAYDNLVCPGAGLMRAHMPWSGWYEASAPIWLSAHTTQFVVPGWRYLSVGSTGSGLIKSSSGNPTGTWVALVPPSGSGLTVVVETLVNDDCIPRTYEAVTLTFRVTSGAPLPAPGTTLHIFRSRRDALFVQEADVTIDADGTFSLSLLPDEMVTASTTAGATRGNFSVPIPDSTPWPLPFAEDFNDLSRGEIARFFSDQGGAWASDGDGAYVQMGWGDPGSNGWGADWTPTTQFGDESWAVSGIEFRRAQCGRT